MLDATKTDLGAESSAKFHRTTAEHGFPDAFLAYLSPGSELIQLQLYRSTSQSAWRSRPRPPRAVFGSGWRAPHRPAAS